MIMVHGADYFPYPLKQIVQLIIDGAAEGFLCIAGVMVGWRLLPVYLKNRKEAIQKIFSRAIQILLLHYFLILTIDLPIKFFITKQLTYSPELFNYLLDVFLWQEQPYILDILPVFVTMFILTPILLELYYRRLEFILFFSSAAFFVVGLIWPYAISVKTAVAFPVIQWQIYYVIGTILGHRYDKISHLGANNLKKWAFGALLVFFVFVYFRHGMKYSPEWLFNLISYAKINIQKFPISFWGLIFSLSLLAAVSLTGAVYLPFIKNNFLFQVFMPMFGRNSLLSFSLHVYFDYLIKVMDGIYGFSVSFVRLLYFINLITIFVLLAIWDKRETLLNNFVHIRKGIKREVHTQNRLYRK
jgi:hypothetical protein